MYSFKRWILVSSLCIETYQILLHDLSCGVCVCVCRDHYTRRESLSISWFDTCNLVQCLWCLDSVTWLYLVSCYNIIPFMKRDNERERENMRERKRDIVHRYSLLILLRTWHYDGYFRVLYYKVGFIARNLSLNQKLRNVIILLLVQAIAGVEIVSHHHSWNSLFFLRIWLQPFVLLRWKKMNCKQLLRCWRRYFTLIWI